MTLALFFWIACTVLVGLEFLWMCQHRCVVRGFAFTAASGLLGMFFINFLGTNISLSIPVTHASIAVTGTLGLPGCAFLLFLKLICLV